MPAPIAAQGRPEEPEPAEGRPVTLSADDAEKPREPSLSRDKPKTAAPLGALAADGIIDPRRITDRPAKSGNGKDIAKTPAPKGVPGPTELELPDNIDSLLSNALVPSGLPAADTEKFYIEGRPDLLVRVSTGRTCEEMRPDVPAIEESMARLAANGVHVLPSKLIEHEGVMYTVTKWIDGVGLEEALRADPSPELLEAVDNNWKGVCNTLVDCLLNDYPAPNDVTQPFQYMYGTIDTDTDTEVWLADPPVYPLHPRLANEYTDQYAEELLDIASHVQGIEEQTGHNLFAARTAIEGALAHAWDSIRFGDGLVHAVRAILNEGMKTHRDDGELFQRLRTR
jgi:hypothetical protein